MRKYLVYLSLVLVGCQDSIDFDLEGDANYLIVDGFITNQLGPHIVRLSRSAQYSGILDGGLEERVSNATLCIRDENDNCTDLIDIGAGEYATPANFRGQEGSSYSLHITTEDGNTYKSTTELLTVPGPIDRVYMDSVVVENVSNEGVIVDKTGLQFYIDFTFPDKDYYYLWDWESTFILKTYYDGGVPDSCFIDEWPIEYLNILESNVSTSRKVENHPIVFKDIDFRFSRGFSLNVQQYAVSRESFLFHQLVESQLASGGSIFDAPPTRITGNIKNTEDEQEIVLGYFGAYGLSEKRTFVDSLVSFIPSMTMCLANEFQPPPNLCFDCSQYTIGGNLRFLGRRGKPEYWEE